MDLYAENIMDHYKSPRFKGELEKSDITISQKEANHSCGDALTLDLKINGDKIEKIAWRGEGCAISQSAMSILLEEAKDMSLDEILDLNKENIYEMLGVPISARRSKCATLSLMTLKNAILKHRGEKTLHFVDVIGG